jgi:hypothetical protein
VIRRNGLPELMVFSEVLLNIPYLSKTPPTPFPLMLFSVIVLLDELLPRKTPVMQFRSIVHA